MSIVTHRHFSSSSELHSWLSASEPNRYYKRMVGGLKEWMDNTQAGINSLITGSDNVDEINALIEQFQLNIETPHRITRPSVRGHRVNMGAYLSGSPLSMYQRDTEQADHTPLRVWVGMGSSIAIPDSKIIQRGATLAAFAMAMSARRPVLITPYFEASGQTQNTQSGAYISYDLQSSPIYLNELAAAMHANVARYAGLWAVACESPYSEGGWVPGALQENTCRQALGAAPDDIWLAGIHLSDPMLTDPIAWIKTNLAKYTTEGETE